MSECTQHDETLLRRGEERRAGIGTAVTHDIVAVGISEMIGVEG